MMRGQTIRYSSIVCDFASLQPVALTISVSGHGTQIKDQDGEEADGYDEGKNM
jgi:hypothetical protein